jgi:hypothetical protein
MDNREITVCSECLCACCWHGEFYCDKARDAGTVEKRVPELRALNREHPDNWSAKKMAEVYGEGSPQHMDAVAAELQPELEKEFPQ